MIVPVVAANLCRVAFNGTAPIAYDSARATVRRSLITITCDPGTQPFLLELRLLTESGIRYLRASSSSEAGRLAYTIYLDDGRMLGDGTAGSEAFRTTVMPSATFTTIELPVTVVIPPNQHSESGLYQAELMLHIDY